MAFSGVELLPLAYGDLIDKKLNSKLTIPLAWERAKVVSSDVPDVSAGQNASCKAVLQSIYTSKAIGLVKGGWLPAGLAANQGMIVLPDRNVVSLIKGRFHGGIKKSADDKDFLDFFLHSGIRVNPMLCAVEGNLRRNPSPDVVRQQIEEVINDMSSALPSAEVFPSGEVGLKGVVGIVADTLGELQKRQQFLMRISSKLKKPTSYKAKDYLWDEIIAASGECSVSVQSLVVIAALSAISVPMGKSPAKRLLKIKNNYSIEDTYNALADIRSLEIFMCLMGLFPDEKFMLCTGDKDLALLWAGIGASEFKWDGGRMDYKLSLVEEFLPGLTQSQRSTLYGS